MPTSSPFGFRYMLCFYDLAAKYLEVYYLRNATAADVQNCFKTFLADTDCTMEGENVCGSKIAYKGLYAAPVAPPSMLAGSCILVS
eukprot:5129597-Pleurochrysis_carterae.AAC.1